jgi:cyclophilin family peptidyl-prolyl cis-trans isomerase
LLFDKNDNPTVGATPTATTTPSAPATGGLPTKTGTVTAQASPAAQVACGGTRPAAADTPKPQFDHAPAPKDVLKKDTVYTAVMRTSCGTIRIQLDPTTAPQTSASFVFLAEKGYFDGQFFHRVVDSIDVIQTGDPLGTGSGGPGYTIPDELTGKERYAPGTVAMANGGANTGGSQFFIITGPQGTNLDGNANYTIFGRVVSGLDVAKTINALMPKQKNYDGAPTKAVYIESITIETAKAPPSASAPPSS